MSLRSVQSPDTPFLAPLFGRAVAAIPITAAILCMILSTASLSVARAADLKDAKQAMQEKNYPRVVEILDAHLAESPDDHRALLLRGEALVELNVPDKALTDLNRAIELQPTKNGRDLVSRGRAYISLREYNKALADLNKAVDLDLDDAVRYYYRGGVYFETSDYEAAFLDFHKALEIDPTYIEAFIARGYTQWRRGTKSRLVDYRQGENTYQILQFESVVDRDLVNQGLADLGRAIELEPDNVYAYHVRASFYQALMEWPSWVADIKQLIRLSPDDQNTINELAWFLATIDNDALRDGKTAVELAEKACELNKYENPVTLDTLAAALAEDRKFKKAIEAQEKAITKLGEVPPEVKVAFEKRLALYRQKSPLRMATPSSCDVHTSTPEAPARPLGPRKRKREANLTDTEQALLRGINVFRKERGLKPVTIHPVLVDVCREHARWMVAQGAVSDNFDGKSPHDKFREVGVEPGNWGITVGRGASAGALLEEWKNTPGPEANILNADVTQLGIGTAVDDQGNIYSSVAYVEIK